MLVIGICSSCRKIGDFNAWGVYIENRDPSTAKRKTVPDTGHGGDTAPAIEEKDGAPPLKVFRPYGNDFSSDSKKF
ncbi:MAG: hypothetical protein R2860_03615 [Desulfobacterales bacterium]